MLWAWIENVDFRTFLADENVPYREPVLYMVDQRVLGQFGYYEQLSVVASNGWVYQVSVCPCMQAFMIQFHLNLWLFWAIFNFLPHN